MSSIVGWQRAVGAVCLCGVGNRRALRNACGGAPRLIDELMDYPGRRPRGECVLEGRFGTPTSEAVSGTEHELGRVARAWAPGGDGLLLHPPILADGSRGACAMAARLEFRDALPEIAGKDVEIGGVRGLAARGGSAPALPRPAHRRAALAPATTASCVFSCVHRCRVRTGFGGRGRLRRDSTMAGERCTAL